jgi:FkbM family methyltransferase
MAAMSRVAALSHRLPAGRWKVRVGRVASSGLGRVGVDVVSAVTMQDGTVLVLDPRGRTEGEAFWHGTYEEDDLGFLRRCLGAFGRNVLDIGANVGLIAVRLAHAGAHVEAIEPVPENAERIAESARLNGLGDAVQVRQLALGEAEGTLTLIRESDLGSTTGNAVSSDVAGDSGGVTVVVPQVRLDSLDLGPVDLVKIDVEGAETPALRGGRAVIEANRPVIMGEFHSGLMPRFGHSFLDVADLLSPLGYRYFSSVSGTEIREQSPRVGLGNVIACPTEKVDRLPTTLLA